MYEVPCKYPRIYVSKKIIHGLSLHLISYVDLYWEKVRHETLVIRIISCKYLGSEDFIFIDFFLHASLPLSMSDLLAFTGVLFFYVSLSPSSPYTPTPPFFRMYFFQIVKLFVTTLSRATRAPDI